MKKIIKNIKFEINSLINSYNFWKAKRKANKMHRLTGKRYHVVPASETKLMVVNNDFVKEYNRLVKKKGHKITIEKLLKMSYYSTPVQGVTRN
jgi:hypothetical protein